jgi:intein/homing endonuclease
MAEEQENKSVFSKISQLLRGKKDVIGDLQNGTQNKNKLINGNPFASNIEPLEKKQQDFLDFQSLKIAKDLYTRSMYYETDRIAAYQDFLAMDMSPEISAALDIISDECCTMGEDGAMLSIYSDNVRIKQILKDFFDNVLNINFNLKNWIRNMCKMGDEFLYLEMDRKVGIYGLRPMQPAEMHREESFDGKIGSVRFRSDILNEYFDDFQFAHFRILSDNRRLPYGRSILDPARKIWKQLQLAEDAMLVYRLCLDGESRIRTVDGYKYIKDISVGDKIFSYNYDGKLVESNVINHANNGNKKLLRIRSIHNELICTENHPILINENGVLKYVDAKELQIKKHQLINTNTLHLNKKKEIELFFGEKFAKPSLELMADFRKSKKNKSEILREVAHNESIYNENRIKQFIYNSKKGLPVDIAIKVCEKFEFNPRKLIIYNKGFYNEERLNLPKFVTPEFAKLLGFLMGDGFFSKNLFGFAEGTDEELNIYYKNLLEKYFTVVKYCPDNRDGHNYGTYCVNSTLALNILKKLGFSGNAHTKRIPSWMYQADPEIRKQFIIGLSNADGCERFTKKGTWNSTIELCNKKLIEDVKELWSSIGLCSGHIKKRFRKGGHFIDGTRKIKDTICYGVNISELTLPKFENVISVEEFGEGYVYDITVDNELHNFISNNVPVHNTRAPDRRIFYVEVGNLDPNDVEQYIEKIKAQVKKQPVVDQRTGQMNLKYDVMPVWKNTPIPLLDGRTITIENLAKEFEQGKQNYVYSVQDNTNQIVAGKVVWCGKNYSAKKLAKVWLDDETYVLTAPEHPFITRDGIPVRADELEVGQSLMPFYRDEKKIYKEENAKLYETIYDPSLNKFEFTHRLIAKENKKEKEIYNTIHHVDYCRLNNNPSNLQWVDFHEHRKMHGENSRKNITKYNKSAAKIAKVSKLNKERDSVKHMKWYNTSELHKQHDEIRRKNMNKIWSDDELKNKMKDSMKIKLNHRCFEIACEEIKKFNQYVTTDNFILHLRNTEFYDQLVRENKETKRDLNLFFHRHKLLKFLRSNGIKSYQEFILINNPELLKDKSKQQSERTKEINIRRNHKVLRVEIIDVNNEDVYCMTVDGINEQNDRHNFAILSFDMNGNVDKSGIFVKNSYEEDFFIPIRNDKGMKVETLPGACLALDTKIPLLDGRSLMLSEIIKEYEDGKKLETYSINPETGEIVPGIISWAGVTRKNTQVIKIILDNGESIVCTPDHKFPTKFNGKKEAKDLKIGESMWAFNKKFEKIKGSGKKRERNKYEMIFDHKKNDWVYTHRMVANYCKGMELMEEFIYLDKYENSKKETIHHKNFDRYNNNTFNLCFMNAIDHLCFHQDNMKILMDHYGKEKVEEWKQSRRDGIKNYWKNITAEEYNKKIEISKINFKNANLALHNRMREDKDFKKEFYEKTSKTLKIVKNTEENKKRQGEYSKAYWKNSEYRKKIFEKQSIKYSEEMLKSVIEHFKSGLCAKDILIEINKSNSSFMNEFNLLNENNLQLKKMKRGFTHNNLYKMMKHFGYYNWRDFKNKVEFFNHKIVSIEWLEEKIDTGTITIDGNETFHNYHNFALNVGIFTQNSNMADIADVEYLQNKLFAAIKVPKPYLNYGESIQGGSTLAQSDLRFARTINSIQQAALVELIRIANIHLILLGFEDDYNNFKLKLANPSTQQELLILEARKARIEVYNDYVKSEPTSPASATWGMQNILGWSNDQIKDNFRQKKMEKKMYAEIEGAPEEYKETGIFYDLDKIFRKVGYVPNQNKKDGEGEESGGDGGFGGGGSFGGGFGGGGLGGDFGGGESGGEDGGESSGAENPEATSGVGEMPDIGGGESNDQSENPEETQEENPEKLQEQEAMESIGLLGSVELEQIDKNVLQINNKRKLMEIGKMLKNMDKKFNGKNNNDQKNIITD